MPKQYEKIKAKYLQMGMPEDQAQEHAARVYNAMRKSHRNLPKLSSRHHKGKMSDRD